MDRIILHLAALVVLLPLVLLVSDALVLNFFGLLYLVWLCCFAAQSDSGKRFCRRYYHEILRLENMM